jgi:phosphoribosylaminoimidazole-succinocarboxamide synthase
VPAAPPVLHTSLSGLSPHRQGKVRDLYDLGDSLLIVATDRISAFDYVLGSAIPDKGKVLTQLSAFWFGRTQDIVANHLLSTSTDEYPPAARAHAAVLDGRSMLVRRTTPLPIECVARGYLSGSGWKDYQKTGSVCGVKLPPGLRESDRLPEPIFTPATKADTGHDINISESEAAAIIGADLVERLRTLTLALYQRGAEHAESLGIMVADTKFEFGTIGEELILIDEVLTPDSSRFWDAATYEAGRPQASFDKQFVRDWLETQAWDKAAPGPELPPDVIAGTRARYIEAYERITGASFDRYLADDVIAP